MGKKKKSDKKQFTKFLKKNRLLLAALGGTATGIAIASVLGTEKARHLIDSVEESVKKFTSRLGEESSGSSVKQKGKAQMSNAAST